MKFVLLHADYDSSRKLSSWCSEVGLDLTRTHDGGPQWPWEFDFHCTVMASDDESTTTRFRSGSSIMIDPVEVAVDRAGVIGVDEYPCLYLSDDGSLDELHAQVGAFFGLSHSFESLLPHVTLSYSPTDAGRVVDAPSPDPIRFDRMTCSESRVDGGESDFLRRARITYRLS